MDLPQSRYGPRHPSKDFAKDWMMLPKNLDHQRRKRKGFPRSSGGCITCKGRRVKCDEQKPACLKCAKSGRQCDGYFVRCRRPSRPQFNFVHWRPKSLTLSQQRPRVALAENQMECRAFDFFRSKSAVKLSGFYDSSFWCRLLLQASHEEPIIQHAVTALGALYETTQNGEQEQGQKGRADDPFALQQYNKAIMLLNRDSCLHGKRSIAIVLLACVLFIAFECMRGNHEASVTHLRSGLSVFRTWQAKNSEPTGPGNGGDRQGMESELINMFIRINHTALIFIDKRLCPTDTLSQEEKQLKCSMPIIFQSLSEARDWFHRLVCLVFQNSVYKRQYRENPGSLEPETSQTHQELYNQWLSTYHTFIKSNNIGIGHREFQGALLLDIHSRPMKIVVKTGLSPKETDFDACHADFESIVSLASSFINEFGYYAVVGGTTNFSFERGLTFTLYFTAVRCRDPWIRRQALSLLSGLSRQEGLFNSKMLSSIAEQSILIEEDLKDINDVKISKSHEVAVRLTIAQTTIFSDERKVLVKFIRTKPGASDEVQHELITY